MFFNRGSHGSVESSAAFLLRETSSMPWQKSAMQRIAFKNVHKAYNKKRVYIVFV